MLTFGSLFSGIGGFDLGFENIGMKCLWQFEIDKIARSILKSHFDCILYNDIRKASSLNLETVDIICGGDPCPCRSKAKGNRKSKYPDLSGYFLALVGKMRPAWVVRENVPAPDDKDFATCLELFGYRTIIVRTDAYAITCQNRKRDFIVGCLEETKARRFFKLCIKKSREGSIAPIFTKEKSYPCISTKSRRCDSRDGYIWDGSGKIRIADKDERVLLAGFPVGWLKGISDSAISRLTGNSVIPGIVSWIGRNIVKSY